MGHPGHGQVHAHFRALTGKVGVQAVEDLLLHLGGDIRAEGLAYAHHMLGGPGHVRALLLELRAGNAALGALLRGGISLVNITANGANPLLHNCILLQNLSSSVLLGSDKSITGSCKVR